MLRADGWLSVCVLRASVPFDCVRVCCVLVLSECVVRASVPVA